MNIEDLTYEVEDVIYDIEAEQQFSELLQDEFDLLIEEFNIESIVCLCNNDKESDELREISYYILDNLSDQFDSIRDRVAFEYELSILKILLLCKTGA